MHAKHIKKHKTWPENKEKRGEKAKKKRYDIDTDLQTKKHSRCCENEQTHERNSYLPWGAGPVWAPLARSSLIPLPPDRPRRRRHDAAPTAGLRRRRPTRPARAPTPWSTSPAPGTPRKAPPPPSRPLGARRSLLRSRREVDVGDLPPSRVYHARSQGPAPMPLPVQLGNGYSQLGSVLLDEGGLWLYIHTMDRRCMISRRGKERDVLRSNRQEVAVALELASAAAK